MDNWYLGRKEGISIYNEPPLILKDITINSKDIRQYPDTKSIYEAFHNLTGLDYSNFILTNGCEEASKCALLVLRPTTVYSYVPGWPKVEKLCEALNIKFKPVQLGFEDKITYPEIKLLKSQGLYSYYTTNGIVNDPYIPTKHKQIVDCVYSNITEIIEDIKQKIETYPNTVFVGSFSKTLGAGIRLGFCIYNSQHSYNFHLQKPHNINTLACYMKDQLVQEIPPYYKELESLLKYLKCNTLCVHPNFVTFTSPLPFYRLPFVKTFNIDNQTIYRICTPLPNEVSALVQGISNEYVQ